ncbi:MAG: hypothetical protein A2622_03990 [Bdellovibrionales bacterium RIFCSPHIGHO2_01_FULL_40_29]|nr:MAG: hypothetical protein A2622_03990 [Bdellovibrionales bacterium RIFCSPHIGHO2_01_FULL_40_29]OFZ35328.1 MAG: hypothetical protein A3D17_08040 [Bdellovibrionales bacterium RIFCSPHIGHO2_02_FULL_40_15]
MRQASASFSKTTQILRNIGVILLATILYYVAARMGLLLATINNFVSPVWPAAGVAACLAYIWGFRVAPGIIIAALLANTHIGLPLLPAIFIAFGNTAECFLGVGIFRFLMKYKDDFGVHAGGIFAVFAIGISVVFGATIGTSTLYFFKIILKNGVFPTWTTWWIGDAIGALFLIPFVYKIYTSRFPRSLNINGFGKIASICIFLAATNYFVFLTKNGAPFLFLTFFPLLSAGIWLSSFWIYTASLMTGIGAILATVAGHGPFYDNSFNQNLIHLQLFLLGLGVTALGISSLQQEGMPRRISATLISGWLISGLIFYSLFNLNHEIDQNRFQLKAEQAETEIDTKIKRYISFLNSGVSFFNASTFISRDEWREFTKILLSNQYSDTIEVLAVAFSSKNSTLKNPHFIVKLLEPRLPQHQIIGFDLASDPTRLQAAIRARDSGEPTLSNLLHLKMDQVYSPGALLLIPIYKTGMPTRTIRERRKFFVGFVLTPIRLKTFIQSALKKFNKELHLTVKFDSPSGPREAFVSKSKAADSENVLVKHSRLAGQPVTYYWRQTENFETTSGLIFSLMSFLGSLVTLLVALVLSSLQQTTAHAKSIADSKTKEILEKNRIWKLLTETAPVGIHLTDDMGKCTYVNPTWKQLSGLTLKESLGDGWLRSIHPEDTKLVIKNWSELKYTGVFNFNFRFLRPDGRTIHVDGRAVPLLNNEGKVVSYLVIIQDMTDSVKKNNALAAAARMSSLGEMASGIAHEVNNPLSIILGNADLLESMLESENFNRDKAQSHLHHMISTVHRIAKIIRGLRAFARETTGEPFESCTVKDVVGDTLELCRERFSSHQVKLILPEIDSTLRFMGRSEQMAQVLLNLLNNAFDAAQGSEQKWVQVSIKIMRNKFQISVTDSGTGIKSELTDKIFEPFYTTKVVGKGTGLGLSISKGIVENHKGTISLDTSASHTTFVIELPRLIADSGRNLDFL